ncbi:TCR/Tet family MFS transporter (plasmid) [Pseudoalteromonas xiamenensis]|uniref:TCR/Tet family MFS transporter n=1 Tax=Pseudoalteromonas xiamenensis TaxID=882626 RepID=UPI0027E5AEE9|nr:TCR/Tet family MFS transporter [Pseudoalteromonas xiamenensis]WMN61656.1 TCR/Tet family MFS transporter [Pseudoalteromonas xiamenensis]
MKKSLIVIYLAVILDAVGIGIIFPVLPVLLEQTGQTENVALYLGAMSALYATMQFVFSPILGALSDKFGRKPILVLSIAGACINYVMLSLSSSFTVLFAGRAVAGMTSATMAIAFAYIADRSTLSQRSKRFGMLNAMFGTGFLIGPILGGLLGEYGAKAPFMVASFLSMINLLLAMLFLSESNFTGSKDTPDAKVNLLRSLRMFSTDKMLQPLMLLFFLLSSTGEAYGVCWALWGKDTFNWSTLSIGVSLGLFGVCQIIVQAYLADFVKQWFGDVKTVILGLSCACLSLIGLAVAWQGWQVYWVIPLFSLGTIGTPILQALASKRTPSEHQGELQGVLMSIVSLASIIAPLLFSSFYFIVKDKWTGAIWLLTMVFYVAAIPLVLCLNRRAPVHEIM